jgi:hypothetical protein
MLVNDDVCIIVRTNSVQTQANVTLDLIFICILDLTFHYAIISNLQTTSVVVVEPSPRLSLSRAHQTPSK